VEHVANQLVATFAQISFMSICLAYGTLLALINEQLLVNGDAAAGLTSRRASVPCGFCSLMAGRTPLTRQSPSLGLDGLGWAGEPGGHHVGEVHDDLEGRFVARHLHRPPIQSGNCV